MNDVMNIEGHAAVVSFDAEPDLFRGEFAGFNGGADFYASSIKALREEGACSLHTFLAVCRERNIDPYKTSSDKSMLQVPAGLYARAKKAASVAPALA